MSRQERLRERNRRVRKAFSTLNKKHPQWRTEAMVEAVAQNFYLSPRTVEAILKGEGTYTE